MKSSSAIAVTSIVFGLILTGPAISTAHADEPSQMQGSQLPTRSVDQLKGSSVINQNGDSVGRVTQIVREKASNKVFAVVSVGALLGIVGGRDVALPLEQFSLRGDKLVVPPGTTKEMLEKLPKYDDTKFVSMRDDEIVTVGSSSTIGGGSR